MDIHGSALDLCPRPTSSLAPWPGAATIYCIAGIWTDTWWDNPVAWKSWACAFHGWSEAEWQQFASLWARTQQLAPHDADRARSALMAAYRLYFYNWRRTPGGSTHGDVRHAARQIRADLQTLRNVVLVGHSKGGAVIKYLLGADWPWRRSARDHSARYSWTCRSIHCVRWWERYSDGACAPPCAGSPPADVSCLTINNWLDLSGGRLRGVENIQVWLWNDNLQPYPPHGMKSRQAPEALGRLRALIHAQHRCSAPDLPGPLPTRVGYGISRRGAARCARRPAPQGHPAAWTDSCLRRNDSGEVWDDGGRGMRCEGGTCPYYITKLLNS